MFIQTVTNNNSPPPTEFEDALVKCKIGKFNYILIITSGCLMSCAFVELTSINLVLPFAQCDLNLSTSDKGILGSVGYLGVILASFLWGFLSDVQGRRKLLISTLLIATLMTALSSLVTTFWLMSLFRFLNGFFIACASSTTFAYLGEFHAAQHRAKVLLIASIIYSFESFVLPLFAILIMNQEWKFNINFLNLEYKPWRLYLFACSIPNLICAAVLQFYLLESPKYTFSRGNEAETLMILRKIFRMNTGKSILEYDVREIKKNEEYGSTLTMNKGFFTTFWKQSIPLFQGKLLRHILTACFLQFSMCLVCNGFWVFLPEIINQINLFIDSNPGGSATACEIFNMYSIEPNTTHPVCVDKLEIGTFIYVFEIVGAYLVLYALISQLINRVGKLIILEVVLLIPGAAAIGIMFLPQPSMSSYLYIIMILTGLGIVVVNASTIEIFPTKMRAMAVCVSMMFGRVGSVVGSMIIGVVIDNYCKYTFLMPVILLFTSGVLAFTIPNIGKRIK